MKLEFNELTLESRHEIEPFFKLRDIISCEYNFNVMYLWAKHNQTKYAFTDNFLILTEVIEDKLITLMPICKEEHFKEAFEAIYEYFQDINTEFRMYVADKTFKEFIIKEYGDRFEISTYRDYFDYLYDADKLRTLSGKKFNKKRNHLNAFIKEFEGRFIYKKLNKEDKEAVCKFLREWKYNKEAVTEALDEELQSICKIICNIDDLDIKAGAIVLDDKIQAISIGSLTNNGKVAVIHVEKANENIRGMYQVINQQFLLNEFPNVEIVNREEDLGIEGLRKSKLSYNPIEILEKYSIIDRNFNQ